MFHIAAGIILAYLLITRTPAVWEWFCRSRNVERVLSVGLLLIAGLVIFAYN
jgi:hypothetical protein